MCKEVNQEIHESENATNIGVQNNYGIDLIEAKELFGILFENNFPKFEQRAMEEVNAKMEVLKDDMIASISDIDNFNFKAFENTDVLYTINKAQIEYARYGEPNNLSLLSKLLTNRIENFEEDIVYRTTLDDAIDVALKLKKEHLDLLAKYLLVSMYSFGEKKNIQYLQGVLQLIETKFGNKTNRNDSYLMSQKCLEISNFDPVGNLSKMYEIDKNEIKGICPESIQALNGEVRLSGIGRVIAHVHTCNNGYKLPPLKID